MVNEKNDVSNKRTSSSSASPYDDSTPYGFGDNHTATNKNKVNTTVDSHNDESTNGVSFVNNYDEDDDDNDGVEFAEVSLLRSNSTTSTTNTLWRFPWQRPIDPDFVNENSEDTKRNNNNHNTNDNEPPSNERLLIISFVSFFSFALVQTTAAIIAKSEAMVGDSAAMYVDAFTYLFNYIAERRKSRFDIVWEQYKQTKYHEKQQENLQGSNDTINIFGDNEGRIKERYKRKMILKLELIPPLISVITLLIVIIFVLKKAIHILILDEHRDISLQSNPNLNLMLTFSVGNLFLDIFNVTCFAKANHLMGFETSTTTAEPASSSLGRKKQPKGYEGINGCDIQENLSYGDDDEEKTGDVESAPGNEQVDGVTAGNKGEKCDDNNDTTNVNGIIKKHNMSHDYENNSRSEASNTKSDDIDENDAYVSVDKSSIHKEESNNGDDFYDEEDEDNGDNSNKANLNMCSAYTHVFADTIRSIAVIIASIIAELVDNVTPEEADATAAVIVSVLILLSLLPLFTGLIRTYNDLKRVYAEEEAAAITFPTAASSSSSSSTTITTTIELSNR